MILRRVASVLHTWPVLRQFSAFTLVGGFGLLVDMAALAVALNLLGLGLIGGRLFSYLVAATFTWACNRRLTFGDRTRSPVLQWLRYLVVGAAGGAVNFVVYLATVKGLDAVAPPAWGMEPYFPYVGTILGSAAGLVVNFTTARKLIFRPSS